jgi:Apoptosis antagonizing transcription factor
MQKLLTVANRLPSSAQILKLFSKKSSKIESGLRRCRRETKTYLKDLAKVQRELFALSETTVKVKNLPEDIDQEDNETTADSIYKTLDSNFNQMLPFVEETIDRWNSRTQMMKNLN